MRNLYLVGTGNEFAAVPQAAGGLHSHNVDSAGNDTDNPTYNVVGPFKIHKDVLGPTKIEKVANYDN